jgi:hypothetical protein
MGRFCAEMAEGLHAMAQPLTILRSSVVSLAVPGLAPAHQERYINISAQQVERACALFDCLQDLVIANQIEAACVPFTLAELLDAIADDRGMKLEASGVKLKIVTTEGLQPILGDFARTLKALLRRAKDCGCGLLPRRYCRVARRAQRRHGCVDNLQQARPPKDPEFIGEP